MDLHRDSVSVVTVKAGLKAARLVAATAHGVDKLRRLRVRCEDAGQRDVVHEAGPTGFGLRRASDRVWTGRRDGKRLAE